MQSRAVPALLFLAALSLACNRPRWDTPVNAYLSFARAMEKADQKTAWDALSEESRAALEARAKAVAAASGGVLTEKPQAYFFGGSYGVPEHKDVKLLSEEGNVARLSVVAKGGAEREVRMVKEPQGWRLDVTELLAEEGGPREQ